MLKELVTIAEGIRIFTELRKDGEKIPHPIPGNILAVLKRFKRDYDSKNIASLRKLISENYTSNIGSGQTKEGFISYFKQAFDLVPRWANLKLRIDIYQVLEDNENAFRAVVSFNSDIALGFIPFRHWDLGEDIRVELAPDGDHGIWRIKGIFSED